MKEVTIGDVEGEITMTEAVGTASPEPEQSEDLFMKSFDSSLPIFSELPVQEVSEAPSRITEMKSEPISNQDGYNSSDTLTASECEDEDITDRNSTYNSAELR